MWLAPAQHVTGHPRELAGSHLEASAEAGVGDPDVHGAHEGGCGICQTVHLCRAADVTVHPRNPALGSHLHIAHHRSKSTCIDCNHNHLHPCL